ncbi:TPA: hypothetical protein ACG46E_000934 [Stenotrophomonas maltophilia]|nr:hypothetical protein [Stenotrophomonas maltophilia]
MADLDMARQFLAAEFESAGLPHVAGGILAGISPFGKGVYIAAVAAALSARHSPGGQDELSAQAGWMLPDDARLVGVIADNIERGKLDHPGFYRNTQLAEALRRVLSAGLAARQPIGQEPFGWWLQDDNGVGYFSRTMQPAALFAHRTTPSYSATPLYAARIAA